MCDLGITVLVRLKNAPLSIFGVGFINYRDIFAYFQG